MLSLHRFREASAVWKTYPQFDLVAVELVQELFHRINLYPTNEQSEFEHENGLTSLELA